MGQQESDRCLNCDHPVDDTFCAHCGQRNTDYRVSLWHVLREMLGEAFELDGRVPRTLVPFLFKPGILTREYNAGRRARFTSPFRLFLAMTLLWFVAGFIVTKTTDFEAEIRQAEANGEEVVTFGTVAEEDDPPGAPEEPAHLVRGDAPEWAKKIDERWLELQDMPAAKVSELIFGIVLETLPKAILVLIPVFALLLKILFLGTGRFYVEHLVFALHLHAFGFLLLTIGFAGDDEIIPALIPLVMLVYTFLALRNAYEARWWTTLLRFGVVTVFYGLFASAVVGVSIIGGALI